MSNAKLFSDIDKELHDMCEPHTNLSAHLKPKQIMSDIESMRTTVDGTLIECRHTFENISRMRQWFGKLLDQERVQL